MVKSLIKASLLLLLLAVLTRQCDGADTKKKKKTTSKHVIDTNKYANVCVGTSTSKTKEPYKALTAKDKRQHAALSLLIDTSSLASIKTKDSPQHKAACWMIYDDSRKIDPRSKRGKAAFLQRYALVVLYHATNGMAWKKSDLWLSSSHECKWAGISCYEYNFLYSGIVERIRLSFNGLDGLLPRELSLLTDLQELDLHGNDIQGVIPHLVLVGLKSLNILKLHMNSMFGVIPKEIGKMTHLKELVLFGNYFAGKIPPEVGQLKNLEVLDVYANFLTGQVPSQISQLSNLKELHLNDNNINGKIPDSICKLPLLTELVADCLGPDPEVTCSCATVCCRGLPDAKCFKLKKSPSTTTGKKTQQKKKKNTSTATKKKR